MTRSIRPGYVDVQFVDFDGVRFKLSTPDKKSATILLLSMNIRCWSELANYGVNDVLQRVYAGLVVAQPEPEYDVSLEINLDQLPPEGGKYSLCVARMRA